MHKTEVREYASVILVTESGNIVLQLRDNNPAIVDPDKLSLFAGQMREGETKEQAVRRTLLEETTLDIPDLSFLFTYQVDAGNGIEFARKSHVFLARDVSEKSISVQQGQGYRTIRTVEDLGKYDFALISKNILHTYFEKYANRT